jgi:uncharacterized membrane protein
MPTVHLLEGEDTDRIDGLSDGLFAIVLTLLVLQFQIPDVPADRAATELPAALADQGTLLFSYLLSFGIVGVYWIVHHNLFERIVRHDRGLLYANLVFLLFVSFIPFPTELVGIYGTRFAWTLYALNLALVGLSLTGLWWYAYRRGFTSDEITPRIGHAVAVRGLIGPAVFLVSIAVASVSLRAAFLTPILIFPLQALWLRLFGTE